MTFDQLQEKALAFRDARDWKQFHNPKDLAISLNLEAAELLECFQWSGADLDAAEKRDKIGEELADVLNCCILMAEACDIDLLEATSQKIDRNAAKYPVEKARGSAKKYSEL